MTNNRRRFRLIDLNKHSSSINRTSSIEKLERRLFGTETKAGFADLGFLGLFRCEKHVASIDLNGDTKFERG